MVLGKFPRPGRPTNFWMLVGQGPIALAVGAGGGCLNIFTLLYLLTIFLLFLVTRNTLAKVCVLCT